MPSSASVSKTLSGDHLGCLCHRPELQAISRRIGADLSRREVVAGMAAAISSFGLPKFATAETEPATGNGPSSMRARRIWRSMPMALRGRSAKRRTLYVVRTGLAAGGKEIRTVGPASKRPFQDCLLPFPGVRQCRSRGGPVAWTDRARQVHRLIDRPRNLGFAVQITPVEAAV
jgi:hypothetical protein